MHICLFDIDGTLLNAGGAGQAAMEAALEIEFGITRSTEGISTAGRTDRAIMVDLFQYHGIDDDVAETWDRFLAAYLDQLPAQLDQHDGLVLPGIRSLLQGLSARDDVVLGLLTGNFRVGAQLKLEHYGLAHHFRFGGFGDHYVDRDDVAREALDQARSHRNGFLDLNRVWVIGDTPADVRCGRAVGAKMVAVATGLYSKQELEATRPDHLFDDFSDAESLLALLD